MSMTSTIHITGDHALMLMRAARAGKLVRAVMSKVDGVVMPPDGLSTIDDLGINDLMTWLGVSRDNPVQMLVPDADRRSWMSCVHASVLSADLPPNSVLEIRQVNGSRRISGQRTSGASPSRAPLAWDPNTRVFIDAPPLALLHAARTLQKQVSSNVIDELEAQIRLIALGCECCGSYARDPFDPLLGECHFDDPGTCRRFVTPEKLSDTLANLSRVRGLARARKAASNVLDYSGSPMETFMDLGLFLPPRLAGLSLHRPIFNQQLRVSKEVRALLRHQSLRPDIQWPDQNMLGEYLGDKEHAGKAARVEDKNRIQDYATAQYTPVLFMYDDVRSIAALNRTAVMLAKMLMQRGVKNELYRVKAIMESEGFHDKQNTLGKVLLPPVSWYE